MLAHTTVQDMTRCYTEADKCYVEAARDRVNASFWRRQEAIWIVLAESVDFQNRLARCLLQKNGTPTTGERT